MTRDLVPAFVKLLKDTEAEVRTAVAGQIPGKICNRILDYDLQLNSVRFLWTSRPRDFAK